MSHLMKNWHDLQNPAFGRLIHRSLLIGLYYFESFFLIDFLYKKYNNVNHVVNKIVVKQNLSLWS